MSSLEFCEFTVRCDAPLPELVACTDAPLNVPEIFVSPIVNSPSVDSPRVDPIVQGESRKVLLSFEKASGRKSLDRARVADGFVLSFAGVAEFFAFARRR